MSGEVFNFENLKLAEDMRVGTAEATSSMYTRDWGIHNNTLDMGGGTSLSIKQVLLWGGVALLGFWVFKKIRKGGK